MKNNWDFKADIIPTMLLSIQLIKFLILLIKISSLQETLLICQRHFDTVDHSILLKKLKLYGINKLTKILHGLKVIYNRKQYNETSENSKIDLKYVHFCFFYMLTTACQIHITYQIQLRLPMILIFSLIVRTLNTSLQL